MFVDNHNAVTNNNIDVHRSKTYTRNIVDETL